LAPCGNDFSESLMVIVGGDGLLEQLYGQERIIVDAFPSER
jgi:hypothetical protein